MARRALSAPLDGPGAIAARCTDTESLTRARASHSANTARQTLDASISEADFQAAVVEMAKLRGWLCFHPYDSRRSTPGFPDLTLVRDGRLIIAELKSERGVISPHQHVWLGELREVARERGIEVFLWRPSQWDEIVEVLA